MNGNTLYIIGNGFDCFHELDTGVNRFQEILRTHSVYNENENAEDVFFGYNVFWGNYEEDLSDIDLDSIVEENIIAPDYTSDHEYDRDGGIFNMEEYTNSLHFAIQKSLEIMVNLANQKLQYIDPKLNNFLTTGDAVLNFNYTSTLECLYRIPEDVPILHIHGCYQLGEPLLFGFSDGISYEDYNKQYFNRSTVDDIQKRINEIEEDIELSNEEKLEQMDYYNQCLEDLTSGCDFYIGAQRDAVYGFYQSLKKELQLKKLRYFLIGFQNIENVIVMGHSMSNVDSKYMELIDEILHPKRWFISKFCGDPSQRTINGYSFANKVEFYSLKSGTK